MSQINFKSRVKVMALISFIGSVFLIGLIVGSIAYIVFKILENIIWRCPKCKAKLPKGKYTNTINECLYCNYELI